MVVEVPAALFVSDFFPQDETMAWNFLVPRRSPRWEYGIMDMSGFPGCRAAIDGFPSSLNNDRGKRSNQCKCASYCKKQKKEKLQQKEQSSDAEETGTDPSTKFALHIALGNVHPRNIKLRVEDGTVKINVRRERRNRRGYFVEEISQEFKVPDGVDDKTLKSSLTDGVLTIEAPKALPVEQKDTRYQGPATSTMEGTENNVDETQEIPIVDISMEVDNPQKLIPPDAAEKKVVNEIAIREREPSSLPDHPLSPLPVTPCKNNDEICQESLKDAVKSTDDEKAAEKDKEKTLQQPNADWVTTVKLSEFKPEDVSVKVADNVVMVQARKEQEDEHGSFFTEMNRRFTIPGNVDVDKISSRLFEDGTLKIIGPRLQLQES